MHRAQYQEAGSGSGNFPEKTLIEVAVMGDHDDRFSKPDSDSDSDSDAGSSPGQRHWSEQGSSFDPASIDDSYNESKQRSAGAGSLIKEMRK